MSGTRDINQPGNYKVEQEALQKERQNLLYPHGPSGHACDTLLPGLGLGASRIGSAHLSNNFVDIETNLYGIGSNNLVSPLPPVRPDLIPLGTLNVFKKEEVVDPLFNPSLKNQRLRLVHSDEKMVRREY